MADTRQPQLRKPPPSQRDFIAGPTGSGKTHLLMVWARRYPRQLVLDVTGEWSNPRHFEGEVHWAADRVQLEKALDKVASLPRWRVVVPTERLDPEELTRLLVPIHRPGRSSFPRAVGGMALVIDEAAELASHADARKVRALWLRGRHHGLSILAATQRAADVGRMVTSQSERVAVLQTGEPLDLGYWRQALRPEWYEAVLALGYREALVVDRVKRTGGVYSTDGRLLRPVPMRSPVGVAEPGTAEIG